MEKFSIPSKLVRIVKVCIEGLKCKTNLEIVIQKNLRQQ